MCAAVRLQPRQPPRECAGCCGSFEDRRDNKNETTDQTSVSEMSGMIHRAGLERSPPGTASRGAMNGSAAREGEGGGGRMHRPGVRLCRRLAIGRCCDAQGQGRQGLGGHGGSHRSKRAAGRREGRGPPCSLCCRSLRPSFPPSLRRPLLSHPLAWKRDRDSVPGPRPVAVGCFGPFHFSPDSSLAAALSAVSSQPRFCARGGEQGGERYPADVWGCYPNPLCCGICGYRV